MADSIRWGILGTGRIAGIFATGLQALDDADLVAVGSRSAESAERFGEEYDIPRRHATYEALASDPDVDAVYVASPHSGHMEHTMLLLNHGKAVICEKPFAINAEQAKKMVALAREKNVFLMEAMWTRFLPYMGQVREWVASGVIGEPRLVTADFGFRAPFDPERRLFNPELGGGALLDVGVYCVSLASMVFGESPARIAGLADLGETGVDEQAAITLGYSNGRLASLVTAVRTTTTMEARIFGTEGSIHLEPTFWNGSKATLRAQGGEPQHIEMPYDGNGYNYEAAEVMRCLRAGETESPVIPLDESIAIMETLDAIRAQWGLKYPME